ncbi:MAG TPA: amino acid permease, partial [Thermosynechococcaceae cyanobacterium]
MAKNRNSGGVSYEDVDDAYLERRQLRRSAGWILLWALGVGAVISGEFSGWNLGLAAGGFWGLAIATVLMAIMYVCMVFSIAEMSSALPHAGGSYSFTRNAFGPFGGFVNGITDACEFVLTPAVVVYFIGSYLNTLEPLKNVPIPVWWVLFYVVFVGINIIGVELTLKFGLFTTVMAASVLVIFYLGAIGKFDSALLTNIAPDPGQTPFLPKGIGGIFAALPYAIWFFLGIEQLPLAAEEAHDSGRDVPKALTWGIFTLLILAFLVLVLNSGVASGADGIGKSGAPLA